MVPGSKIVVIAAITPCPYSVHVTIIKHLYEVVSLMEQMHTHVPSDSYHNPEEPQDPVPLG